MNLHKNSLEYLYEMLLTNCAHLMCNISPFGLRQLTNSAVYLSTLPHIRSFTMDASNAGKACPDAAKPGRAKLTQEERDEMLTPLTSAGWTLLSDRDAIRLAQYPVIRSRT